jgi:hypothetical protein
MEMASVQGFAGKRMEHQGSGVSPLLWYLIGLG